MLGASRAQALASCFGLSGRVDLYQAFLVAMINRLRPNGLLGVITSNRFLTTKGGAATRRLLRSQLKLLEVVDLGDTKLFEAAVLPALVFGTKRKTPTQADESVAADFVRVYEHVRTDTSTLVSATCVCDLLRDARHGCYAVNGTAYEVATGKLTVPLDGSLPWTMQTCDEAAWVSTIQCNSQCKVGDVAKIRVGVKTTADNVFIRRDWDSLPRETRPESQHLKALLWQECAPSGSPRLPPLLHGASSTHTRL